MGKTSRPNAIKRQNDNRKFPTGKLTEDQQAEVDLMHGNVPKEKKQLTPASKRV